MLARDQRLGRRRASALAALQAAEGRRLDARAAAGSTAASSPTARTRRRGGSRTGSRATRALEWAWAWPANRRLLYNRASADPDGKPWSERKKLVWWDEEQRKWTGTDTPDFDEEKPPDYVPPDGATGPDAIRGRPPVHHAGRRARLDLRPAGARGRAAADALRAARVAVRQPALRAAREPAPAAEQGPAGGSVQPGRRRARLGLVPVRRDDVPAHRAPQRRRLHALHAVPRRSCSRRCSSRCIPTSRASAASSTAAGRRSSRRAAAIEARVMVTDRMRPVQDRRARAAPGRAAVPLGLARAHDRRRRERPHAHGARPERPHPGGQGAHLRHPARPPAARREAAGVRRGHRERAFARARRRRGPSRGGARR